MKFYGRVKEIENIERYRILVHKNNSAILVVTGRRRIGKTRLIIESLKNKKLLYFYVSRKKENELIAEWSNLIREKLGNVFFGKMTSIDDLLSFLFSYSQKEPLSVVFDEFQNFNYSNKHVYSVFQKHFDLEKYNFKLLMIFSGSSFSLMEKIFKGNKEPLFGRASDIMQISYLPIKAQKEFLSDINLDSVLDRIFFFATFDGVPKYWEHLDETVGRSFKVRLKKILTSKDWIWDEGEMVLKEEFGKDYTTYYSILSAIAKGRRLLSEIEHFSGISDATAYLHRLDEVYNLIEKKYPVTESKYTKKRKRRWYVKDNFFRFWFGLIEPKRYLHEIGQKETAAKQILENLNQFTGRAFEKMIIRLFVEENPLNISFTRLGSYWDRKGEVEIDVVAYDEMSKKAYFFEVKLDKKRVTQKVVRKLIENSHKIPELEYYHKFYYTVYPENNEITFNQIVK